jgi:replicative DNA helicase
MSATSDSPEPREPRLLPLDQLLGEWERDAEAAHEARISGRPRGPITGHARLDEALGGALSPGLHVVHGQPGSGKTAFGLQTAAECGYPALYVTCEMSALELFRRTTARVTSTYLGRLKNGELRPIDSLALARQAAAAFPNLLIADATQAYASPAWIESAARVCRGEHRHLLIVVDSVHSWAEAIQGDASEYDALNAALAALRSLASRLECPVLVVAERNRASMRMGGLSAGAGTRKLEYGAETVMDLCCDPDARPDGAGEVDIELVLAKNRNGAAGKRVKLRFHGALQRFREAG